VADPKRLVILKRITSHLADEITLANGYQHDLGGTPARVSRGRAVFGANTPLPHVTILENLNPDTDSRSPAGNPNLRINTWQLLVQGWVSDDEENPTDPAYLLAADVQKALAKLVPGRVDGMLIKMSFEAPVVRPPDEVSSRAYFWLRLRLELVDDSADPYRLTN